MAQSIRGSLSAGVFLDFVESMERLGLPSAAVLAACGLSRGRLRNPFARFDAAIEHPFWSELERVAGDPAVGLELGVDIAQRGRRSLDMYIAFNSGTLRDMLENTERFAKLSDDRGHVQLVEQGALATVSIHRDGGYPRAFGYIEALFAAATSMFAQRVNGFRLREVRLPRPTPRALAPYRRAFGVAPCFDSVTAEFSFERSLLEQRLAGSDATLAEILKEHASELLRKIPTVDPLLYAVQTALFEGMQRGQVGLSSVARATGMSTRTLRRRLSELGTTFHAELDQLRHDLAVEGLRSGQESIAQIAERLSYASAKGFQSAFRRWTGVAPSVYRQRQREAPHDPPEPGGAALAP